MGTIAAGFHSPCCSATCIVIDVATHTMSLHGNQQHQCMFSCCCHGLAYLDLSFPPCHCQTSSKQMPEFYARAYYLGRSHRFEEEMTPDRLYDFTITRSWFRSGWCFEFRVTQPTEPYSCHEKFSLHGPKTINFSNPTAANDQGPRQPELGASPARHLGFQSPPPTPL